MPYRTIADLPFSVRQYLPEPAQVIYREAFDRAYAAHAGEADREQCSRVIAWAAVKRCYVKDGERWVPRDESPPHARRA